MIEEPSKEDLERDARVDLWMCDATIPGPWYVHCVEEEASDYSIGCTYFCISPHEDDIADSFIFSMKYPYGETNQIEIDCLNFSQMARAALPYWIRRAVTTEKRVKELEELLEVVSGRE